MGTHESWLAPRPLDDGSAEAAPSARIAVVDSDSGLSRVLAKRISATGWRAETLPAPPPVDELAHMRVHAVVIDLALLGGDAWTYLERLCTTQGAPAVLVCTGPATVAQRVRGLRLGADDWVTKPCHPEELLARVEAAVRRRQAGVRSGERAAPLVAGELEIRADMFEAFVGGRPVGLTRREFELVQLLGRSAGRVVPREHIYERVWGYAMVHGDRSVDVFVRRVRQKLERASPGWRYLHTHFGIGYRFEPAEHGGEDSSAIPATLPPPE
jgi:DNA-binding response OmpR family regulator